MLVNITYLRTIFFAQQQSTDDKAIVDKYQENFQYYFY